MDFQPRVLAPLAIRWSRPLAMTVAIGWLAWALAQWTWTLLPSPPTPPPATGIAPLPAPASSAPQPRLAETINAAALWGRAPTTTTALAQDTRLPLTLRGVLAGQGLALIAASGQPERVYQIGDTLPGGALLRAVEVDHVLLDRGGVLERLALPKPQLSTSFSPAPPGAASTPTSLRAMLQGSPAELAKQFRIEPVMEGGTMRGYRIRALRDPALLARAGLEPEDILLSLNGRSLLENPNLAALLNEMRDASVLEAVVLRRGIETPLRIDLNG